MTPPMTDHLRNMARYTLPCSPSALCEDRFSILEDEEDPLVPSWKLLKALLSRPVLHTGDLIELLELIAVSLRGTADSDYGFLRQFFSNQVDEETFFSAVWPTIVDLALRLPELFPLNSLPVLTPDCPLLALSREQVACLVVHQFLCTLAAPTWQDGFQSFHIWYGSFQPHQHAVEAYLHSLYAYLKRSGGKSPHSPLGTTQEQWAIKYQLVSYSSQQEQLYASRDVPLNNPNIKALPSATTAPDNLGLPNGAAVVSANRYVGFGRSGTQEETFVGASPEACPAVLVTPPLGDDEVLIVTGAEAMVTIDGYGRNATCKEVLTPLGSTSEHADTWRRRTMLFMDALELDVADQVPGRLPDLEQGRVARELRKASCAFSSYRAAGRYDPYDEVVTGFWGCRAFGGNPAVKALIQWVAAVNAGCLLTFTCSDEMQWEFGEKFREFADRARQTAVTCAELEQVLLALQPTDIAENSSPFDLIKSKLPSIRPRGTTDST